nr:DEAD/DEAH box helicase [uncultured Bacteroides sp.]
MKFSELQLNDKVLEALEAMRFEECTPIQEKSIPVILEGKDLIAVAQTGTGKTAAYLLPILNRLSEGGHPEDAINCIIMAPTRELAQQIDQQMEGFSYFMPVSSVAVYGGNDGILFEQQKKGLTLGADVVIATPGRLIAHLSLGYVDLSRVSYFILDEADRMLDMGFYDDIMQIVKFLPKERQTVMFSATMPAKIQQLANTILNNPAEVKLAVSKPAEKIVQAAYICYENQKLGIIRSLFAEQAPERVIIFASSKLKVKEVTKALKQMQLNVGEMHSDLEQAQREEVMYEFKAGRINILVATDIVARGIDIDDIRLVINYDVPHDSEDYVHRIGRTARANNDGVALTFVSEKEQTYFKSIETFLEKDIYKIPVPEELGEAPEFKPRTNEGYKKYGKSNRRNGNGKSNFRNNNRKGGKRPPTKKQE